MKRHEVRDWNTSSSKKARFTASPPQADHEAKTTQDADQTQETHTQIVHKESHSPPATPLSPTALELKRLAEEATNKIVAREFEGIKRLFHSIHAFRHLTPTPGQIETLNALITAMYVSGENFTVSLAKRSGKTCTIYLLVLAHVYAEMFGKRIVIFAPNRIKLVKKWMDFIRFAENTLDYVGLHAKEKRENVISFVDNDDHVRWAVQFESIENKDTAAVEADLILADDFHEYPSQAIAFLAQQPCRVFMFSRHKDEQDRFPSLPHSSTYNHLEQHAAKIVEMWDQPEARYDTKLTNREYFVRFTEYTQEEIDRLREKLQSDGFTHDYKAALQSLQCTSKCIVSKVRELFGMKTT